MGTEEIKCKKKIYIPHAVSNSNRKIAETEEKSIPLLTHI